MNSNETPDNGLLSVGMVIPPAPKPAVAPTATVVTPKPELNAMGAKHARKAAEKAAKQTKAQLKATAERDAINKAGAKPIKGAGAKKIVAKSTKVAQTRAAGPVRLPKVPKGHKKVKMTKADQHKAGKVAKPALGSHCSICGKPLSRESSVERGIGDVCEGHVKLLPAGVTMAQHYEKLTLKEIPEGWIPLAKAVKAANAKHISTYRFFQVIGGDRLLRKPLSPVFQVKFFKHARYIQAECLKHFDIVNKI
jgi:hypothetical protein